MIAQTESSGNERGRGDHAEAGAAGAPLRGEYHLKLTGPRGMIFDRDLDERGANAVMLAAMGPYSAPTSGLQTSRGERLDPASGPTLRAIQTSVREYWSAHGVRTIPQKIVATGAYLRANGQATFTREDLMRSFEDAGEPMPKNLYRDLTKTIGMSLIAPSRVAGEGYYVTARGLEEIGEGEQKEVGVR